MNSYPLSKSIPDKIKSKTGKTVNEINIENILSGKITSDDIKISKETLIKQGEIAEDAGRPQLKENFDRAAELTEVPDDVILKIYNMLRPNRSTKNELLNVAAELRDKYSAAKTADFVLEAAKVYETRGILKK